MEQWHYSRKMPRFKLVKIGVWEDDKFVGAVIFGQGATPEIGKPFGLKRTEVCELVRVALTKHKTMTTRIVRIALGMLRKHCPGIRLVVSFADSAQGHHGGIYAGGNWLYLGMLVHHIYRVNGRTVHPKTLYSRYGRGGQSVPWLRKNVDHRAERVVTPPKHKYVMPFDEGLRRQLMPMAKPYPKRATSIGSDATAHQAGEGGASPTVALCGHGARTEVE